MGKTVFAIVVFAALLVSGFMAHKSALDYEHLNQALAAKMDTSNQAVNWLKNAGETLSFGLYDGHSEQAADIKALQAELLRLNHQVWYSALAFLLISLGALAVGFFFFSAEAFVIGVISVSLLALIIGVFSPMMYISAYKDLPVIGEVVLSFQSKSIASTIGSLFEKQNYLVAIAILSFSIILPLLKSLLMLLSLPQFGRISAGVIHWLHGMGRWSMADVLVVSVLLVFFSLDSGDAQADIATQSELQIGLYFFFYYVVLSIVASQYLPSTEKS